MAGVLFVTAGLLASLPRAADAQVAIQVQLLWEWSDDGWRRHQPRYSRGAVYDRVGIAVGYAGAGDVVYRTGPRAVRIPPGHLPPPGSCRVWYPGRPPGHQPPPRPCGPLFRTYRHPGVVILGAPEYDDDVYGRASGRRGGDSWKKRERKGRRGG